jgi:hypothetical protein
MKTAKVGVWCGAAVVVAAMLAVSGLSGCSTLDRAYQQEVTCSNAPVVHVFTNTVVMTNTVPMVVERTNVVYVTNATTGAVSGYVSREPMTTNMVTAVVTNFVPVFYTNVVQVPVTTDRQTGGQAVQAAGICHNTFAPGIGSIVALALAGLYHGYRQVRNRKVNEALVKGVETARAVLTTTPQGQAVDAQFVKWLMDHQKEAGVFTTVSGLVEQLTDNPAAKLTAQEIAQRVQQARSSGRRAASGNHQRASYEQRLCAHLLAPGRQRPSGTAPLNAGGQIAKLLARGRGDSCQLGQAASVGQTSAQCGEVLRHDRTVHPAGRPELAG